MVRILVRFLVRFLARFSVRFLARFSVRFLVRFSVRFLVRFLARFLAGFSVRDLVTVMGASQTRRCDSLAGLAQTDRLAGLCAWAGGVKMTVTGRFSVNL